jgi:hypothetical protein
MSIKTKSLSKSYFNGIAKAMDITNSTSITKNNKHTTISQVWANVGDEIISAMIMQNKLKNLQLNKKLTELNHSSMIQKSKLLAERINKIKRMNSSVLKNKKLTELNHSLMIQKSKLLAERISRINKRIATYE